MRECACLGLGKGAWSVEKQWRDRGGYLDCVGCEDFTPGLAAGESADMHSRFFAGGLLAALVAFAFSSHADELRLASFVADVTPPIGSPLCNGSIKPAANIEEPLTARGVVLIPGGEEKPIVLCVADFVGIYNASHDAWRKALAEAAGTTPERVSVHTIHNHDAPGYDVSALEVLEKENLPDSMALRSAHGHAIETTAAALRDSLVNAAPVTHLGLGKGVVEEFASNRRILGPDGKLALARMSSCRNPEAVAAPEGTIDPELDLVSFWNGDEALAVLTFYASHPQSYYGRGGVTPDTVGIARNRRSEETGVLHVHFDGAGGNVAAGKYNDGSPEARAILIDRVHAGMKAAWEAQEKRSLAPGDLDWTVAPTSLPWGGSFSEEELVAQLTDPDVDVRTRIRAARDAVYLRRWKEGAKIDINCLRLGDARLLFFPGELFVEYQLAAKAMRPDDFVALAAYGDGGPGYIGTEIAYSQGGYEVGRVSRVSPDVQAVLEKVTRNLLEMEP
ncbi:MAG: hypothetical protein KDN19_14615 [Verrucomicrobiae bacterium]|nr:hypothetical protein [Verrucomicrobiae bacterium]